MALPALHASGYDALDKRHLRNRNLCPCGPRVFGEDNIMASGTGHTSSGHDAELDELLDSQCLHRICGPGHFRNKTTFVVSSQYYQWR